MTLTMPTRVTVNWDNFAAKHIGLTASGSRCFLTAPFADICESGFAPRQAVC